MLLVGFRSLKRIPGLESVGLGMNLFLSERDSVHVKSV